MKEKILKIIFHIAWISLIVLPFIFGTIIMINGANDPWSGNPLSKLEAFEFGAIFVYITYLLPYILLCLGYILFYIIKNRKKKWVKVFLITISILIILVLLSGLTIV